MAKQKSILPIEGTIGGITFYKSKDGFMARGKGGVSKDRIQSDPAFQRTRENISEFGRAAKASKLFRAPFKTLLQNASDSRMVSRLTKAFMLVIQADETSTRGERNVIDGEAELLRGFEFNLQSKLSTTLYAPFTASIDRATGDVSIDLPAFIPSIMIAAPAGSTHFKINAGVAAVDFTTETYEAKTISSDHFLMAGTAPLSVTLPMAIGEASSHPVFLLLGIEFAQFVNGTYYPLKNGSFNALEVVSVNSPVEAP